MLNMARRLSLAALAATAVLLAGCSGSSSDASNGATPNASGITTTLSGVVFSESKCANVPVTITAADGAVLYQGNTDNDGIYTATVTNPPLNPTLLASATCANADGSQQTLVSVVPSGNAAGVTVTQTVNLNPLANFLSALVSNSRDPSKLQGEIKSGVLTIDAQKQTAARDQLGAMLLQVVKAVGLTAFDPVSTPMSGQVKIVQLLETVNIKFIPQDDGRQTVQIRLKLASSSEADGQPVFQVLNTDLADVTKLQGLIALVSGVSVNAKDLVPAETSALIDDLVARMNLCAAQVFSPQNLARVAFCKAMFVDSDLAKYFNDGKGLSLFGAMQSVDRIWYTPNPMKLSSPSFEYLRPNGILGFKVQQVGNPTSPKELFFDAQVGADGKLGVSGNQYRFRASVIPHSERRTFINQPSSDYLSTGYRFNIPLQAKDGVPVTKVVVTPPASLLSNTAFTLVPGADDMVLTDRNPPAGGIGGSLANAFVRLRSEYLDPTHCKTNVNDPRPCLPSLDDIGQYFLASDLADAAIAAIVPDTQVWKVEFYVGDSATPELAQYYHVPARPMTIAELSKATLPNLNDDSIKMLKGMLTQDEPGVPGYTLLSGEPALSLSVMPGTSDVFLSVQGVQTNKSDGVSVLYFRDVVQADFLIDDGDPRNTLIKPYFLPTTTSPGIQQKVLCANWLNGDMHCASKNAYLDPALGTIYMTGVELMVSPAFPVEMAHFLSVQQLLP